MLVSESEVLIRAQLIGPRSHHGHWALHFDESHLCFLHGWCSLGHWLGHGGPSGVCAPWKKDDQIHVDRRPEDCCHFDCWLFVWGRCVMKKMDQIKLWRVLFACFCGFSNARRKHLKQCFDQNSLVELWNEYTTSMANDSRIDFFFFVQQFPDTTGPRDKPTKLRGWWVLFWLWPN